MHATELLQTCHQEATPLCQAAQVSSSGFEDHQCLWAAGRKLMIALIQECISQIWPEPSDESIRPDPLSQKRRTMVGLGDDPARGNVFETGSLFTKPEEFLTL